MPAVDLCAHIKIQFLVRIPNTHHDLRAPKRAPSEVLSGGKNETHRHPRQLTKRKLVAVHLAPPKQLAIVALLVRDARVLEDVSNRLAAAADGEVEQLDARELDGSGHGRRLCELAESQAGAGSDAG